ncbi:MAG: hypothetical protein ACWGQW_22490 [bacterium]
MSLYYKENKDGTFTLLNEVRQREARQTLVDAKANVDADLAAYNVISHLTKEQIYMAGRVADVLRCTIRPVKDLAEALSIVKAPLDEKKTRLDAALNPGE